MGETGQKRPRGRPQLVLVALAFALPLAAAAWLYFSDSGWRPAGTSNHGALLTPIVNVYDAGPGSPLAGRAREYWVLVYVDTGNCDTECRDALYRLRQARLMLGKDMNRVQRVFLHGASTPDTVFLEREHGGLIALQAPALTRLLDKKRPAHSTPGGLFLLDPLGNLVMYFPADIEPRDMVDDIAHLLRLSRIG